MFAKGWSVTFQVLSLEFVCSLWLSLEFVCSIWLQQCDVVAGCMLLVRSGENDLHIPEPYREALGGDTVIARRSKIKGKIEA